MVILADPEMNNCHQNLPEKWKGYQEYFFPHKMEEFKAEFLQPLLHKIVLTIGPSTAKSSARTGTILASSILKQYSDFTADYHNDFLSLALLSVSDLISLFKVNRLLV